MTRLAPLLALAILLASAAASPTLAQVPSTLSVAPPAVAQIPSTEIPLPTVSSMSEVPLPTPTPEPSLLQAASNLVFEENQGQWDPTALFRVHANGYDAFITRTGMAMVQLQAPPVREEIHRKGALEHSLEPTKAWATYMTLVGSNPAPLITTSQPTEYHTNYFIGNDPTKWHANVPTYTRVTLHDVYPGIDLDYHASPDGDLKYDFIVHPGADPGQIRQHYAGQTELTINPDGTLAIHTGLGTIQQGEPLTKQGNGLLVSNQYALDEATLTYVIGDRDLTQDLIIDPLVYSTYVGGSWVDGANGLAVDAGGNAYFVARASPGYPTTTGAFDTTHNGGDDVAITKLNAAGSALAFSTYLGGSSMTVPKGIALDSAGYVYFTGNTYSTDYPTTIGAYDTTHNGPAFGTDVVVTKLNPTGSALAYSSYIGGNGQEFAFAITVDAGGSAYIAGEAPSSYPTTLGAYDRTNNGETDAFVTKLNPPGSSLTYSTFIGGASYEQLYDVAVDSSGSAYVVGYSESTNYPTTAGAFDTTYNGNNDVVLSKLNSAGSGLFYSTYIGGSSSDYSLGVAVDSDGNAYATGETRSTNYPTTSGAFDTTHNGDADVFVTKLNSAGSALVHSTYLGGSGQELGNAVAVDSSGNAYITGDTDSTGFPTTVGTFDATHNGGTDVLLAKLNAAGSVLAYSTYLGGSGTESGAAVAVDLSGNAYITGSTTSTNYPTTSGAYDTTNSGSYDAFVFSYDFGPSGYMQIAQKPECLTVPPEDPGFCNLEQLGFTTAIGHADAEKPSFVINWGDFNGHEHIQLETDVPRFWMDYDLNVFTGAQGFPDYYGEEVPVAQLERWTGSAWTPVEDGTLYGVLVAPAGADPWRLDLPDALDQLTSDALGTQEGSATFRLNPFDQPGLPGQKWILELTAAQSQLVAPPVIYVHGWNPSPYESASTYASERAGWATSMTNRVTEQSLSEFGQNPWAWSENRGLVDFVFDGKGDFRLASERLYHRILEVQTDGPENPLGADLSYDGPVNLIAHSLGGLVSRYMLEDTLPILRSLNGGHFDDDPDMQSLLDAWNQDSGPVPATTDLVGSVVMMGTPNLGSGWAEKYISGVDKRNQAICPSSDECRYYVTQDGQNLLTHYGFVAGLLKGGHEWDAKAWDKESIGAHRNENYYDSDVSVLADLELLLLRDRDNPVLENLERTFAPPGVHYFMMAGVETHVPFEGDVIVSTKSATHGFDDRACWNRYQKMEANYGQPSSQFYGLTYVSHGDLPFGRKLQDDALLFLSGDHESPCDNQPSYDSSSAQQSFDSASEPGPAEAFGPGGVGMMSLEGDPEPSGYEAPIASNYSVDGATYATRLEWDAPGLTNGTMILYGLNGTLANATLAVRSPSGETTSMETGNTSAILWGDLQNLGPFDRLSIDFPDAQQGPWTAWINRTVPWSGALIPAAWFNTSFAMELDTDLHGVVGQAVTYRVRLPIPDADVALELAEPSGNIETLTLLDDGLGADASAGDGIYSGSHVFLENGTSPYGVQATVDGLVLTATGSLRIYDEEPAPMSFPPWTPLNLSATSGPDRGEITLTWESPVDGPALTGYDVYRGNETVQELIASIGAETTYTDSGLDDDATYHYRIASRNGAGWSRLSDVVNATTFNVPSEPGNLEAEAGIGEVTLTWQAAASNGVLNVTGYNVYRGNASGAEAFYDTVAIVLNYTDTNATPGTRYYYRVSARNSAVEGDLSNEASARPATLLLSLPAIALPDDGDPVVTITVCDSDSDSGCTGSLVVESPDDEMGDGFGIDPTNPGDPDGDHYVTEAEAVAGSNPVQANSTPNTDDDGDSRINRLESPTAQTYTKAYCTGAYGIVGTPGCGHYSHPQGYSTVDQGYVWRDDAGTLWVWDAVCLPALEGDYQTCKATGNRGLSSAEYHGNWTDDGYGWRRIDASPSVIAQTYGLCPDGIQDSDLDGIPTFYLCTSTLTVDSTGAIDEGEPQPWQTVGDSEPSNEGFLCIELQVATAPAVKLACIDHALLPPEVDVVLHEMSPIEIVLPAGIGPTPEIQVTYLHESALLNPVLVACAPLHPTLDDAIWLLANGGESSLTVTLKDGSGAGEPVTVPWLGQVLAAGQATLGGTPCG